MSETLIKKLYLGKYTDRIARTHDPLSPEISQLVTLDSPFNPDCCYDVIFIHAYTTDDMNRHLQETWHKQQVQVGGMLYFIYPKLNNGHYPGIHRDEIFPALGVEDGLGIYPETHYKFNRMVSLNDTFTMMRLKYLTDKEVFKLTQPQASSKPSGRVKDYVQYIPDISQHLMAIDPALQIAFDQLTPGRQRQWAREIYSAKTPATQDKRYQTLIDHLHD